MKRIFSQHPIVIFILGLPLLFVICLCFGGKFICPWDYFMKPAGTLSHELLALRASCLITAFLVGGALAASGAGYQAVLRNPLAEPFILGISGGASLGAAAAISLGLSKYSCLYLPLLSFAGALIILVLVLSLSRGAGIAYSNNILLSGVIAGTLCSSALMFIISCLNMHKLNSVTWWMLGNLSPKNFTLTSVSAGIIILCVLLLFLFGREADAISMGEEMSHNFGFSPRRTILLILAISSLLAATAVSISGIIGFVGLVVPHVLRRFWGAGHRRLFPLALLGGGAFLMLCDTVSRSVLSAQVIPVGIITAFIGGPFFFWMINKKK